jgi:hypothetical protein
MMVTARRLRSMGWIATLVVCAALVMVLAFRVNALRSQVHQSDLRIIALKQDTMYLETEFETRASQQQLKAWNDVEFGYVAPAATAYLDNERQLASYSKPVEPDAPAPIRVASADDSVVAAAAFPAMVSPLSGKPIGEADNTSADAPHKDGTTSEAPAKADKPRAKPVGLAGLGDHLATVHHAAPAHAAAAKKLAAKKPAPEKLAAKKPAPKKSAEKKAGGDKKALARKTAVERVPVKAIAARGAGPKAHAQAHPARTRVADAHHRPGKGSPTIKLALKDAKTVK